MAAGKKVTVSNVATHYRQAEDLLQQAEKIARMMNLSDQARVLALAGLGHALLATAPPTAVAGAQREREQMMQDEACQPRRWGRGERPGRTAQAAE